MPDYANKIHQKVLAWSKTACSPFYSIEEVCEQALGITKSQEEYERALPHIGTSLRELGYRNVRARRRGKNRHWWEKPWI